MENHNPLTEEERTAIRERWDAARAHEGFRLTIYEAASPGALNVALHAADADVRALLAEVERLSDAVRGGLSHVGNALAERDAARAEVEQLRAELEMVRERLGEEAEGFKVAWQLAKDQKVKLDRLAEQVKRVREQHSARRIYGECGHRHEKPDADLGVKEVRSVGLVCEDGYDYTVCRACCCDPDGDQSRECAENHDRECWPCPTIRILDGSEAGR